MTYENLTFSDEEKVLIAQATVNGILDWSGNSLKGIRKKVRDFHRALQGDRCCYCKKMFHDDHPLAVDIEHILPKSVYKDFAILPVNLTVACKRCNMKIKGVRVDFLFGMGVDEVKLKFQDSATYEIVHPNLDSYFEHIRLVTIVVDNLTFVRYSVRGHSIKGAKTVEYFDLRGLEVDNLDEIQGVGSATHVAATAIKQLLDM